MIYSWGKNQYPPPEMPVAGASTLVREPHRMSRFISVCKGAAGSCDSADASLQGPSGSRLRRPKDLRLDPCKVDALPVRSGEKERGACCWSRADTPVKPACHEWCDSCCAHPQTTLADACQYPTAQSSRGGGVHSGLCHKIITAHVW